MNALRCNTDNAAYAKSDTCEKRYCICEKPQVREVTNEKVVWRIVTMQFELRFELLSESSVFLAQSKTSRVLV